METLRWIADRISKALMVIGGLAVFAMMIHITADVIAKYVFHRPIIGTLEIVARYYMVVVAFIPIAYVQLSRQHLTVEAFTLGLKPRQLALLDGVVTILGIVYTAVLAWLVLWQAVDQTRLGEFYSITYFDMPIWPARWVLPISFGMMCIVMAVQATDDFVFAFTGKGKRVPEPDPLANMAV